MSEQILELLEEQASTFEAFKGANDDQNRRLDKLETRLNRGGHAIDDPTTPRSAENKAFGAYFHLGDESELKALSVQVDADGGFSVTAEMSNTILRLARDLDPIRALATMRNVNSDAWEQLVRQGSTGADWVGETQGRSGTANPTFAKKRIPVHEIHAQNQATQKLLDDSSINIENFLSEEVGESFAISEGESFVNGNGVGQPRGFLNYAPNATTEADAARAYDTIQYTPSGASGDFAAYGGGGDNVEPLFDTIFSMKSAYRSQAAWLMNRASFGFFRKLKDSDDRYLWSNNLAAGQPPTLAGFPVIEVPGMPDIAADANAVVFANMQRAYTIVDRIGIRTLRDPFTAKPFVLFDWTKRVGGDLMNSEALKILRFSVS